MVVILGMNPPDQKQNETIPDACLSWFVFKLIQIENKPLQIWRFCRGGSIELIATLFSPGFETILGDRFHMADSFGE
jgi:hypothetical protein